MPRRRVPGAPSSGTPRKSQVNFRVGTVWGWGKFLWVLGQSGQYSGKIRFIDKLEYKTRVVAMFLNVVRTHGKLSPKSNLRDGT